MFTNSSKDRSSPLCSFMFVDGRHCRIPRQLGHPYLCAFHARKDALSTTYPDRFRNGLMVLHGMAWSTHQIHISGLLLTEAVIRCVMAMQALTVHLFVLQFGHPAARTCNFSMLPKGLAP